MGIKQDILDILHPIEVRVEAALADAEATFEADKAAISSDVRAAVADAIAVGKDIAAAVEAALVAHGL